MIGIEICGLERNTVYSLSESREIIAVATIAALLHPSICRLVLRLVFLLVFICKEERVQKPAPAIIRDSVPFAFLYVSKSPSLAMGEYDARLREASFSSYLEANEECLGRKVAFKTLHGRVFGEVELQGGDAYDEDGEIGVFEAEKYFNGCIDEDGTGLVGSMALPSETAKSGSSQTSGMTPSTGSQRSWNSGALLLRRQQLPRRKVSEVRSKSLLASIICCRCTCDGDDSADVGFRDGHDGFIPRGQWPPDFVLEKKLTMLPWSDVVPRKEDQNAPDSCSDATSDLFEIESLTGKASRLLTWHDAVSTGAYAPSEASVEWSVVTESAAATEFSFEDRSELAGANTPVWRSAKGSNKLNRNKLNRKARLRNRILLRC